MFTNILTILFFSIKIWIHKIPTMDTQMNKSSALRVRIPPDLHKDFLTVCKHQDIPASQVLRQFMRTYVDDHKFDSQRDLFESVDQSISQ
ncbi:hypothetical protein ACYX78_06660 [Advenella incenata]